MGIRDRMDTVLNLGLTDETARGMAEATQNPRFAYDSYLSLIHISYPFSRRFFIATLTLGLVNPSSLAMSIERTAPLRLLKIMMIPN